MKQSIKQQKQLKKYCMLDQKRRHEICINPDYLDDFYSVDNDAISVFKGCLYAFAMTVTCVTIALFIAAFF